METEYRKAASEDYEKLIDFGNLVFHRNFAALLPKLYFHHPEIAKYHHLALENGEIKAMTGSFPIAMQIGGEPVRVCGIGTVSVHPDCRGKGYMKKLMAQAAADAEAEKYDLVCLSGQRQRYEYFGFSKAAEQRSFTVTPTNRRHWKQVSTAGISLLPLEEHPEYLAACLQLQQNQPVHGVRTAENFTEICRSWYCAPWVILREQEFQGYAVLSTDGKRVPEMVLTEDAEILPAVFALVEKTGCDMQFSPSFRQKHLIRALSRTAESASVHDGEMFRILNFPKIIALLLNQKAAQTGLPEGSLVLGIRGGERYEITVSGGKATVSRTEKPAAWLADSPADLQHDLISIENLWQYDTPLENSWFPLPLEFPEQDMV